MPSAHSMSLLRKKTLEAERGVLVVLHNRLGVPLERVQAACTHGAWTGSSASHALHHVVPHRHGERHALGGAREGPPRIIRPLEMIAFSIGNQSSFAQKHARVARAIRGVHAHVTYSCAQGADSGSVTIKVTNPGIAEFGVHRHAKVHSEGPAMRHVEVKQRVQNGLGRVSHRHSGAPHPARPEQATP